jgi:hypothetical protein
MGITTWRRQITVVYNNTTTNIIINTRQVPTQWSLVEAWAFQQFPVDLILFKSYTVQDLPLRVGAEVCQAWLLVTVGLRRTAAGVQSKSLRFLYVRSYLFLYAFGFFLIELHGDLLT